MGAAGELLMQSRGSHEKNKRLPGKAVPSQHDYFQPTPRPDAAVAPWTTEVAPFLSTPNYHADRVPRSSPDGMPLCPTSSHEDGHGHTTPRQRSVSRRTPETSISPGNITGRRPAPTSGAETPPLDPQANISPPPRSRRNDPSARKPSVPQNSRNVTPWLYQDIKDINAYGEAPLRPHPVSRSETTDFTSGVRKVQSEGQSPAGQRARRPYDQADGSIEVDRPPFSRQLSSGGGRALKQNISLPLGPSPHYKSPESSSSALSRSQTMADTRPAEPNSGKRGLFDAFRRHRAEKRPSDGLSHTSRGGSTTSLHQVASNDSSRSYRADLAKHSSTGRQDSVTTFDSGSTTKASEYQSGDAESPLSRKESAGSRMLHSHTKNPKPRRTLESADRNGSIAEDSVFALDTNLENMEGIVDPNARGLPHGGIFTGEPAEENLFERRQRDVDMLISMGVWDAPDSWAVKKAGDENLVRLREIDDAGVPPKVEDDGTPYCVRIFRIDATFATLSQNINTTASEVLQILGRKSFLQDDLDNYQIIMRKHDLHRQLAPGERPIAIQKKLLEQAGYRSSDRIEEIGREDNSYLVRFTFVPIKLSGYYSLDKEQTPSKLQKFSHVDLQGRSLITIPITLYQRSSEIISLNLSRNLALDVPKDFIQSCVNLREIRFISNEAWKLPASLSLAARLTVLDISNNRLEQLEHAELHKLTGLTSIKVSNNKLTHLPSSFRKLEALRSLNVSSNYLPSFPEYLCELSSLVDLDISFNAIKTLPKFDGLVSLERFWATNNQLTGTFADQFEGMQSLKEVDIRFNSVTNIDVFARLPQLEQLMAGHNTISKFEGAFERIRMLHLDHNPMTRFDLKSAITSLTSLNICACKVAQIDDSCFERMRNVTKLTLDKNHFSTLSMQLGRLQKLEYLSIAKNPLSSLPVSIGALAELRFLDIRECNLKKLPAELWLCYRLDTLNVSSNVLETFPKMPLSAPPAFPDAQSSDWLAYSLSRSQSRVAEPETELENADTRRPSQSSLNLTRKDSHKNLTTFAQSMRHLYLADNRLTDDVFDEISLLPSLRTVNLSYNELYDIPPRSLRRWPELSELYLSGNELTSLPSDDLELITCLKVLHINANKFQVLPAELGKVHKLSTLDVGSNALKYNVSNWPYDWNWNWNANLRYLNFSGNKRLEIKPSRSFAAASGLQEGTDLTNFNTLGQLRVLGLMDVTLTIPAVPDQTNNRRVRTSGSLAGAMAYGMADTLGRHDHLSTIDMVVPKFRGHESETLLGMFDGQIQSSGGSRLAKYLQENFGFHFTEELSRLTAEESPGDALRRTFLALNKDLATTASQAIEDKEKRLPSRGSSQAQTLNAGDLMSGGVATVAFLDNLELYIANVGDAQAMLMQSDGGYKILTKKHEPADREERERIREAGGYVSRHGKLNDVLSVSRAFGHIQMMPSIMAAPNVVHRTLKESDEMLLIASREVWEYMSLDMVVDVARSERADLMRAAQKLRDLAMAFGASGKITIMMIGVSDLKKLERNRFRGQSLSMVQSQIQEEQQLLASKRGKKTRDRPDDSTLQRLDPEVEAPTGDLALVFTDIKNSTMLWETFPVAMRSAIKSHNEVMRRQLRVIGGYEVKTEGDAFMVAFPTATSALLWCFVVQQHLLEVDWPPEILGSVHCQETYDADENVIYRGLSVRMGTHWGNPVSELDPITRRMDYFGPMVNRSARISGAADGGEIFVSSDFIAEIHRALEIFAEDERNDALDADEEPVNDRIGQSIRRELRALSAQGFEVKDMGTQKLKGLENPELIYLMYPHSLAGRVTAQRQHKETLVVAAANEPASLAIGERRILETQPVWDIWSVSLRLEMLCSALESPGTTHLRPPERSVLEKMKDRGREMTEQLLVSILEHQIARIETCVTTLAVRNMVSPFGRTQSLLKQACPMQDVLKNISEQLRSIRG